MWCALRPDRTGFDRQARVGKDDLQPRRQLARVVGLQTKTAVAHVEHTRLMSPHAHDEHAAEFLSWPPALLARVLRRARDEIEQALAVEGLGDIERANRPGVGGEHRVVD